jgi:hypothetical protein
MALYLDTTIHAGKVSDTPRACIKNEAFDLGLLILPLAAGLGAAAAALANPGLFTTLLLTDLWLLGYQHVFASYTRLAFTADALRRNRVFAVDLLVLVTAAMLALALMTGFSVVATAFFYLQWFHYVRQGAGLARMYLRATPEGQIAGSRDVTTDLLIYLVPIYAIAARSSTIGATFLGLPVKALVLPDEAITALGFAAAIAGVMWILRSVVGFARGTVDTLYTGFVLSHVAIFLIAYVGIADVNTGWLTIDVWHNFQYVLLVWMMNQKEYAGGVDSSATLLSRISQPRRAIAYFFTCVAISTVLYLVLGSVVYAMGGGLTMAVGLYIGLNFHHYVMDALMWKRRRVAPHAM